MSNEVVLKGMMVSLWSGEDGMSVDWGVREDLIGFMMDGDKGGEEMIEEGIRSVIEYDDVMGELKEGEGEEFEEVKKFRRILEIVKDNDWCEIERVFVWSVEYDMNVSVMLVNENFVKDWEGLRK